MNVPFVKMSINQVQYVCVSSSNCDESINYNTLASSLCNLDSGVGAENLIVILNSEFADFKLECYNSYGEYIDASVDHILAISNYLYQDNIVEHKKIYLETNRQILLTEVNNDFVTLYLSKYEVVNEYFVNVGQKYYIKFVQDIDELIEMNDKASLLAKKHKLGVGVVHYSNKVLTMSAYHQRYGVLKSSGEMACAATLMCVYKKLIKIGEEIMIKAVGGNYVISILNYYVKVKAHPKLLFNGIYTYNP